MKALRPNVQEEKEDSPNGGTQTPQPNESPEEISATRLCE